MKKNMDKKGSIINRESEEMYYNRFSFQEAVCGFVHDLKENHFSNLMLDQFDKIEKEYQNTINNISQNDFHQYHIELANESRGDKLLALSEMNIVYSYKEYEINLKRLLKIAYNEDGKNNYQYKNLVNFFKSKGIDIKKIDGADQVDELRKLNNHIKHSNTRIVRDEIKKIDEFNGKDHIDNDDLNRFYQRIKDFPLTFLEALSVEISKELFTFNDKRLESMAHKLAIRMKKLDAQLFIDKLNKLY